MVLLKVSILKLLVLLESFSPDFATLSNEFARYEKSVVSKSLNLLFNPSLVPATLSIADFMTLYSSTVCGIPF